jgi:hypothetical protein
MAQTIVNLTLPVVTEKIDQILKNYPLYPHQELFDAAEMRQKLTAHVLSRLPVIYVTMDNDQACTLNNPLECYSPDQHEQIEQLIRQGIETLVVNRRVIKKRQSSPLYATAEAPSNWFG